MFGFINNNGWEFSKAKLCIVLVSYDFYTLMLLNFALYYCHLKTEMQKSGNGDHCPCFGVGKSYLWLSVLFLKAKLWSQSKMSTSACVKSIIDALWSPLMTCVLVSPSSDYFNVEDIMELVEDIMWHCDVNYMNSTDGNQLFHHLIAIKPSKFAWTKVTFCVWIERLALNFPLLKEAQSGRPSILWPGSQEKWLQFVKMHMLKWNKIITTVPKYAIWLATEHRQD